MTRLDAENLTCKIGHRVIVRDVSLSVEPKTMTAIIGVNGVGKSTLMRALAGINPPANGRVLVDGKDLTALTPRERARSIAFVAQEEAAPEDLTLTEMIMLGRLPHLMPWAVGSARERKIVSDCLELVGLTKLANRRCSQLSGGERRRAMLAKGLAQGTELLLLDEPTNHLDVHHQIHLLQTMRATGRTIVATIHDLDLAMGWFDRVIILADGKTLALGAPPQTMSVENLDHAFKVVARQIPPVDDGVRHLVIDGLSDTPHH
ncbi:ABC transporter ATP-binding protein [Tessaracoccus sp. OH4464_COT-324]|uniref:ABC transporter ATP-binding protein n=1 Tax=Tessaracoccus sp. OH4464_COT-324 TaxID=2491059 RepID=UPI000F631147|nr:ABC transporter ATP-binding protein [Tessaracoccus sp. OH4464_COT-324]RRD45920.1 ABC transporter ATP-binding protein [Tessaracoccus sp. OH4464_COT-324]